MLTEPIRNLRRAAVLTLVVAAGALFAAAPAGAATLTVNYGSGTVSYAAGPGEANQLSIAPFSGTYRIQDKGVPSVSLIQLGSLLSCSLLEPFKYRCNSSGLASANISLGDGADSFDDSGTGLATTIHVGAGGKSIVTGAGNDSIDARNGSADTIDCGAGDDTVAADPIDTLAADCEHNIGAAASVVLPVAVPSADTLAAVATSTGAGAGAAAGVVPGGASSPTGSNPLPLTAPIGSVIPAATVPVPVSNRAVVGLACPLAAAAAGCRGDVFIDALVAPATAVARSHVANRAVAARGHYVAQQRARRRRVGAAHFRIAAGQSAKVPVRIALRAHYTLVSRRRRARAVLKIVERDAAGNVVDVQTRPVTLRLAARKRSHR